MAAADQTLEQQIHSRNYDDDDLVEIKTPIHLPYYNSNEYETAEGSIVIGVNQYNYVKKKVFNDTLYLLCLPNAAKTQLQKDKAGYANSANDNPSNKRNTTENKNSFSNEYIGHDAASKVTDVALVSVQEYSTENSQLSAGIKDLFPQPPRPLYFS